MSLTNPNKVVTEERLNEYHNTILPYLGGMPDILANKFSRADIYSTDEKMIGQWTDGKPLYQKTVDFGAGPVAGNNKIVHVDVANVDKIVSVNGVSVSSSGSVPLPFVHPGNLGYVVQLDTRDITSTKFDVLVNCGSSMPLNNSQIYVIVQYTKTTDSLVEIGLDTDYSTGEKIVGTWIDGKPIYQKTIDCGALPNATYKNFNHNISNISKIISIYGIGNRSNDNDTFVIGDAGDIISANSTIIYFEEKINMSAYTAYVTLQYTKTTD